MREREPHGVLVVDKPRGPTSHDVVARVRKALKTRAVGHAGTLDPMATGVLVVAVGEGTKLVPWLTADDKTYAATIHLGTTTHSLDADGDVTASAPVPDDLARRLPAALEAERARKEQVPPAVSAIRIGGERAHALARAGKLGEAALPPRPVEVRSLTLERIAGADVDVVVEVMKGYYVRSLARDLAAALGTVGHLTALRRIRSGAFTIEHAIALDDVGPEALIPLDRAAAIALPVTVLDDDGVRAVSYGQRVAPAQMRDPHRAPSAWLDQSAHLVAVGECLEDGTGRVLRGFPRPT
ncbi:MAG: tRNA pseudouridine(55) synthase TruB [Labilithrix sp.]|nr:tRNA pseudouridine(55) synthase TruB [Labilithrix sp.]MCW5814053.1 tRNA pseudouridine(55) synthase TruB [Labilithrix sp.]